jgi:hypothetical protein
VRWYIPSWHGDFRLVPDTKDPSATVLEVERPTPDEQRALNMIGPELVARGWIDRWDVSIPRANAPARTRRYPIRASIEEVGPVVVGILRPGPAVLTAVKMASGACITCSGGTVAVEQLGQQLATYRDPAPAPPADEPTAAATVKRPTPCCPSCVPGSVDRASEVLLAFLDEEEHASWAHDRTIVVEGGLSGHRYRIAHRHSRTAQRVGRIAYDLDAALVVHFHDWSVPPEEEVLAAKLILEHREPWLRNEATMLCAPPDVLVFKNPFGGLEDGVADANLTERIGTAAAGAILGVTVAMRGGN